MPMSREESEKIEFHFEPPVEMPDLDPALVSDANDILKKWGFDYLYDRVRRFNHTIERLKAGLWMSEPMDPNVEGFAQFIVGKEQLPAGGMHIIESDRGTILWQKRLSAQLAKDLIEEIDQMGKRMGLVDPETGLRKPLPAHLKTKDS